MAFLSGKGLYPMNRYLSEHDIAEAVESSRDGFMIADVNGRILYLNESYIRLTQLGNLAHIGAYMQDMVDQGHIDNSNCLKAIAERTVMVDVHPTRDSVIVVNSTPVFHLDGSIRYVVTNVQDGTDYLRMYDQIQSIDKKLDDISQRFSNDEFLSQGVIAFSLPMRQIFKKARHIATFDVTVLITGKSGSGKDVVAHYIHNNSNRRERPFISINCGAIPENLMETELFGYAEGTFTGQVRGGKQGLISAAEGGTLFLDEIGEMPLSMQAKLLHVLETNTYRSVGSTKLLQPNVRFICATNQNLIQLVREKRFREDLYYRINVLPMEIPPLRERKDDIYPLCLFFLDHYNKKYNTQKHISAATLQSLAEYDWPGNVRELKNAIEEMVVLSQDAYLALPENFGRKACVPDICEARPASAAVPPQNDPSAAMPSARKPRETEELPSVERLCEFLDEQEKQYLIQVYRQIGSTRRMAEALGVNHSTIMRKLKKYNIRLK